MHRIDHIDHDVRVDDDVSRHPLFIVEAGNPVHARSIDQVAVAKNSSGKLHGGSWIVGHINVGSGQRIEYHRFAHVWVACQDDHFGSGPG